MRLGDLVQVTTGSDKKYLGLIIEGNSDPRPLTGDPIEDIDSMYPYYINFFNDRMPNDWHRADSLEVISESR